MLGWNGISNNNFDLFNMAIFKMFFFICGIDLAALSLVLGKKSCYEKYDRGDTLNKLDTNQIFHKQDKLLLNTTRTLQILTLPVASSVYIISTWE